MKAFKASFGSDRKCDILYRDDFKKIVRRWNGLQHFRIVSDKEPYIRWAHFSYKLLGIWETAHLLASHQRFYTSNYSNIHLHFAINYSHFNNNTSANVYNVMTITTSIKHLEWQIKEDIKHRCGYGFDKDSEWNDRTSPSQLYAEWKAKKWPVTHAT